MELPIVKPHVILMGLARLVQGEHHLRHHAGRELRVPLLSLRACHAAVKQKMVGAFFQRGRFLDLLHEAAQPFPDGFPVRPAQEQVEEISAFPAEKLLLSQLRLQKLPDILQQEIGLLPSEDLVHELELIDVQGGHPEFPITAPHLPQLFHKAGQIAAARQRIPVSGLQQLPVAAL